jgi:hypothetical protein
VEEDNSDFKCAAEILSISSFGAVKIEFNREIAPIANTSALNSSHIDMYIKPFDDWHLEAQDFNIS